MKKFIIKEWQDKYLTENTLDDFLKGNIEPYEIDPKDFPIKDIEKLQKKIGDWPKVISILHELGWEPVKIPSSAVEYFNSLLEKYGQPEGKVFHDGSIVGGPVWEDGEALDFNDPTHYISYWKGKGGNWYLMVDTSRGDGSSSKDYKKLGKRLEGRYKKLPKPKVKSGPYDAKKVAAKMYKVSGMKYFADDVAKMKTITRDDLEDLLPDYIGGHVITQILS